jgi:hypothetical protein
VGFVVDKVALGQVFSEYFGFRCKFLFRYLSTITITYHLGLVQKASSGRSAKRLSLTPLEIKKNTSVYYVKEHATVGGSIPDGVIAFLNGTNPSSRTMTLGVDPASNKNEYQESSWG